MTDTSSVWLGLIETLLDNGDLVTPRGKPCREVLACQTNVSMVDPVVQVKGRKLGYRFMAAEAHWIISGDNRLETILPYANHIKDFSDDGFFFYGAYGPRVVDQLSYVARVLAEDLNSRQAVLTIWRSNPHKSKDIPCTVAIQWFIRDGKLHCIDTMRSSDAWLGWPYDVVNFSCLSYYLRAILRHQYGLVMDIGDLVLQAGSQHIYERNEVAAREVLNNPETYQIPLDLNNRWEVARPQVILNELNIVKDMSGGFMELATLGQNAV
jgi:thymidylate synthase